MLEEIKNIEDLRNIPVDKLGELAKEVRQRIIGTISKTGGHLASSLGVVDLTIALHYCLNTPKDLIVWDVGHQTYAHKILTGRNKDFDKIRQHKGISGFPYAPESDHDPFTTGHSSTSVSLALGMAVARDYNKGNNKIVAVIGDGSLSGGMCFEALNHAGHLKTDLIVVLNTNEMSISPSVGALSIYMNKLISLPVYNRVKKAVENFMKLRIPRIGPRLAKLADRFEEMLKGLIVPGIFFEELGFRYFGPFDGHNIELLSTNFKNISSSVKGPIIFHVVTTKGKGYKPAEENPELFHSASKFDVDTGKPLVSPDEAESYTSIFGKYLVKLAEENSNVVAITAAMTAGTGLDLFAKKFPERFFDVGIAEQHAVAFAAGLARVSYKPVVAIYSTFLQRSYDQIIEEACLQNLSIVLCLDRAGLVGQDGPTHHGVLDIVYLRSLPHMVVMAPSNKEEFQAMLEFAIKHKGPISIRYPKATAVSSDKSLPLIELGKAETLIEGKDIAIISLGTMLDSAIKVKDLLLKQDVNATIINARFVKPLDTVLLDKLGSKFEYIFTLEEGCVEGGFGSAVLEYMEKSSAYKEKRCKVYNFGLPCEFITFGSRSELFKLCGILPEQISTKILSIIRKKELV